MRQTDRLMDDSFYLYLPSDGCPQIHPENTQHHYKITLDTALVLLSGEWEVALKEISYMNVLKIFTHGERFEFRKFGREHFKLNQTNEYSPTPIIPPPPLPPPPPLLAATKKVKQTKWVKWVKTEKEKFNWIAKDKNGVILFIMKYNPVLYRMQFTSYIQDPYVRIRLPWLYAYHLGFAFEDPTDEGRLVIRSDEKDLLRYEKTLRGEIGDPTHLMKPDGDYFKMVNIIGGNFPGRTITASATTISLMPPTLKAEIGKMEKDLTVRKVTPQPGYYSSVETMLNDLNLQIWEIVSRDSEMTADYEKVVHEKRMFQFDKHTGRIMMVVPNSWGVEFKNGMEKILGFTESTYGTTANAELPPILHSMIYSLYLHLNIIDIRLVGHRQLQLLRSIPRTAMRIGEVVTVTFENLRYCSLNTNYVHMIEVKLTDDSGHPIQFEEGKTLVVLHFQRRPLT